MIKKNFISGVEFYISVILPRPWIDYNVTPDKKTIFILNESEILNNIISICENFVRKILVIETRESGHHNRVLKQNSDSNCTEHQSDSCCMDEVFLNIGTAHSVELSKDDISTLIPVGQFNNGFIICCKTSEKATEIFAIDQHAADERIRFEEIANSYTITCQKLVQPIKLNISAENEEFILQNIDAIRAAGFLIRSFDQSFFLDALPSFHGADTTIEGFF